MTIRATRFLATVVATLLSLAGCGTTRTAPADDGAKRPEDTRPVPVPKEPEVPFGPAEMRGTWAIAVTLSNRANTMKIIEDAKAARLNAIFAQVRYRGDAWYEGSIEPRATRLAAGFDPLRTLIDETGDGIEVHAWVNASLIADGENKGNDPRHVVRAHPEWLAVPVELAALANDRKTPPARLVEELFRYAAEKKSTVEGVFGDPAVPGYRHHFAQVVGQLCRTYAIDGLHIDYARYCNARFGYSRLALEGFRAEVDRELSAKDRQDMAKRVASDPLAYTKRYSQRFGDYRRRAVTAMVEEAAAAARTARPGIVVSAAVWPDIQSTRAERLQDWTTWLTSGAIDVACPMIYAPEPATFAAQLKEIMSAARGRRVWAGIGAWQIPLSETSRRIEVCRTSRTAGTLLFSHSGLAEKGNAFSTLAAGPYRLRARTR